jgi:DNA repair protein SbcD/Mre11
MKYAHLADLHLGSWRDERMRKVSTGAFNAAINDCVKREVDFILFAGDLFNTSLPAIDTLKIVTKKLKQLKDKGIPLYVIPGSHDFSPSGKTMIDVLENAALLKNVCQGSVDPETKKLNLKFTTDPKTNAKMTGILGRKGQLDKTYYHNLNLENLEQEKGYKIFLFHTTLTELKPKHLEKIDSHPASFLPKGFNYYAGGHIHHKTLINIPNYGPLTYTGALFPNNFAELEKYSHGGYYIIETQKEEEENTPSPSNQKITWIPLEVIKHKALKLNCDHKTPVNVSSEIINFFENQDLKDTIITLRLHGCLEKGKVSDINFKEIFDQLYKQNAYFIMKNTAKLNSEEFEEIKISQSNPENVEEEIIKEHLQQIKLFDTNTELTLTKSLLNVLNTSKKEGETLTDFNFRVGEEINKLLNI